MQKKVCRYFLDTEFIEGFRRPYFGLLGPRRHFIDLVSIGLTDQSGARTYYAVSSEFDPADADEWVQENVLSPIVTEYVQTFHGDGRNYVLNALSGKSLVQKVRHVQKRIGKTNEQIAGDLLNYVYAPALHEFGGEAWSSDACMDAWLHHNELRFYAYYADYDWVLFCCLFGEMGDLPKGFPQYCNDLMQVLSEKGIRKDELKSFSEDAQPNEHNALADALWNLSLFKEIRFTPSHTRGLNL